MIKEDNLEECGICGAVGDKEGVIDHKAGCFEKGEREYKEAMEKKQQRRATDCSIGCWLALAIEPGKKEKDNE